MSRMTAHSAPLRHPPPCGSCPTCSCHGHTLHSGGRKGTCLPTCSTLPLWMPLSCALASFHGEEGRSRQDLESLPDALTAGVGSGGETGVCVGEYGVTRPLWGLAKRTGMHKTKSGDHVSMSRSMRPAPRPMADTQSAAINREGHLDT